MPVWAYIYLAVMFCSGIYGGVKSWSKGWHYLFFEMLCVCFIFVLFALAYQLIILRDSIKLSIWMVLYIICWEFWGNRHHYCLPADAPKKTLFPYDLILEDIHEKKGGAAEKIYILTMYITVMASISPVFFVFYKIVTLW